ncbi:MAG TPA: hypothetical protein PKA41_13370 [Verrucomicrobiota bacterium]|nr:hypothetical protein [Verrucomicrobiota bacterium]
MKRTYLLPLFLVLNAFGQTGFYEQVSSMWYSGNKTGVLSIATQRLQQDTNDIAGLLLKMEYQIAFIDFDQVTNTMSRVLQVGGAITSANFAATFPTVEADINHLIGMIPLYPTNEIAADQAKGNLPNKPLIHGAVIKALQDDGFFE